MYIINILFLPFLNINRQFIFCLSILLIFYNNILYSNSKLILPKYNYGNHQNPEIDKLYRHLKGRSFYFMKEHPEKTMYNIIIYPENYLKIELKMYTDSELLIKSLNNGKKLFFGFDLVINNTDISLSDYNTDIVICYFDLNDTNCNDYIYDLNDNLYKINNLGNISNNNLIPLNFGSVELNLLHENVMEYKNYYCVELIKNSPKYFDNITLLNYFFYSAMQMQRTLIGFYGIIDSVEELNKISIDKMLYFQEVDFIDGVGLLNNSFSFYKYSFYCSISLFILIFIL